MSKGLEALESIRQDLIKYENNPILFDDYGKQLLGIGANKDIRFDELEKELKALEIIKNKGVFVHLLQQSKNVEEYNSLMLIAFKKMAQRDYKSAVEKFCLTEEEYDLLKEVLL